MTTSNKPICTLRYAEVSDASTLPELFTKLAHFAHLEPPNDDARQRLVQDGWGEHKRFDAYLTFVPDADAPPGFCTLFGTPEPFSPAALVFRKPLR